MLCLINGYGYIIGGLGSLASEQWISLEICSTVALVKFPFMSHSYPEIRNSKRHELHDVVDRGVVFCFFIGGRRSRCIPSSLLGSFPAPDAF